MDPGPIAGEVRPDPDPDDVAERLRDLHALSLTLAVARTTEDVCTALARHACAATGAAGAAAWYLDGARRTILGAVEGTAEEAELPPVDLASGPWDDEGAPGPAPTRRATLRAGGEVVGALLLLGEGAHGGDPEELDAMIRVAGETLARARSAADEQRLASIVEGSVAALFAFEPDGTIITWNLSAERMTGYPAAEAIGRSALMLAPSAEIAPPTRAAVDRIQAGGGAEHLEVEWRRKDGSSIQVAMTLSPMRDRRGALTGISVIARDVTSARRSEQRLRRLAAAMDRSPTAVVVVGAEGKIVECTPAAERLLGLARHDALGRPAHFLESGADCGVVTPLQESVARGETFLQDPVWRVSADGTPRRLRVTGYPIPGEGGELSGTVIAMEDVTESAALEEALRRAQRMESLGRLAGGVAHDVNNMLTVIAGYAQIARSCVEDGDGAEALDEIGAATKRVQGLTRRLLAFARRRSVEPASLDLTDVVGGLLPMLRSLVGGAVRLDVEAEPGVPPVRADRAGMEQVLVNLVVNARDAMPRGGDVLIAVRAEEGDLVVLEVSDTGEGMSRATAGRIFEPFFSTKDPGSSEHGEGTGLGLPTVHGTITQAGGDIEVDSAPGRGTRFTIRLPAEVGASAAAPVPQAAEPLPAPRPARILVCEDELGILHLLKRFLGDAGYEVTAVPDPFEALAAAERADEPFDVLVTDVLMPGMSGPQLAERIIEGHWASEVVFISGFVDDSFADAGHGPRVLLGKPFTAAELLEAVRSKLD